jgi:hypothetical protein
LADGVTVIVDVTGFTPVFVAVKDTIFPIPLAPKPMAVLEFVQAKVALLVGLVNVVPATIVPLQTLILAGIVTVGVGYTVMVKVEGMPVQLLADGVTVIVPVIVFEPVFVAVNDEMFPVPFAARPIDVLEFVQAKAAPGLGLVNVVPAMVAPLHRVILAGTVTVGTGLTVTVIINVAPVQFPVLGVTV